MKGTSKWVTSVPLFISLIAIPLLSPTLTFAATGTNVSTVEAVSNTTTQNVAGTNSTTSTTGTTGGTSMSDIDGSKQIPDTTINDANNWVAKKGNDLVGLGGTIAEPISIIGFMVGLLITLAGAVSKSNHIIKGLLVMAISIGVYVGTVFAPELVQYFSTWLSS